MSGRRYIVGIRRVSKGNRGYLITLPKDFAPLYKKKVLVILEEIELPPPKEAENNGIYHEP